MNPYLRMCKSSKLKETSPDLYTGASDLVLVDLQGPPQDFIKMLIKMRTAYKDVVRSRFNSGVIVPCFNSDSLFIVLIFFFLCSLKIIQTKSCI